MDFRSSICLQWIGKSQADGGILDAVKDHLEWAFEMPVRIRKVEAKPSDAFDAARGQYSSTKILRWLLQDVPAPARKILAITDVDLYIPVLTFVFGEAQVGGQGAVVSTARLRMDLPRFPSPASRFLARLLKECVHELGHTFGLIHCPVSRCVMSRSNTILEVDAKRSDLCKTCRSLLKELQDKEQ
jgi:archaemetzincin